MGRFIDADLLGKELEKMESESNWTNISEYQFEPYTNYTISKRYDQFGHITIDDGVAPMPIGKRYDQCKHCGAPGQVVGEVCEYCGQAV